VHGDCGSGVTEGNLCVLSIMPKIAEILVKIQMERSVLVSSNGKIQDRLCGPLILVGIFRPKYAVPFLANRFFALIRELGKGVKVAYMSHFYWLAWLGRKMMIDFPQVFPLILICHTSKNRIRVH